MRGRTHFPDVSPAPRCPPPPPIPLCYTLPPFMRLQAASACRHPPPVPRPRHIPFTQHHPGPADSGVPSLPPPSSILDNAIPAPRTWGRVSLSVSHLHLATQGTLPRSYGLGRVLSPPSHL